MNLVATLSSPVLSLEESFRDAQFPLSDLARVALSSFSPTASLRSPVGGVRPSQDVDLRDTRTCNPGVGTGAGQGVSKAT